MYLSASHATPDRSSPSHRSSVEPIEAYWIEVQVIGPRRIVFEAYGPLETILTGVGSPQPPSVTAPPDTYAKPSVTAPLAAYVDQKSGEAIVPPGQSRRDTEHAVRLAEAYWRDVKAVENSELGRAIREETQGYTPLEIIASGVNELETQWPGAVQTTTFLPDGTGFYTRDATHYNKKLNTMARLHGVRPEIIHRFATAHEALHGRGVTDERQAHEKLYRALENAIGRTDDQAEKREYELLLHVQARELALRYGVKKKPRARSEDRVLN